MQMQMQTKIDVEFHNGTLNDLKSYILLSFVKKLIWRPNYTVFGVIDIKWKSRRFSNSLRHSFLFLIFEIDFYKMGQVTKL